MNEGEISHETSNNLPALIPPAGEVVPVVKKRGFFKKGNKYGKGNPHAGDIHRIRAILFEKIKVKDWNGIRAALLDKALAGDIKAMTLLFSYTLGRPVQPHDVSVTAANISPEEAKARINRFFGLEQKVEHEND